MHVVAPTALRVSVTDPDAQSVHAEVDALENCPARHDVHTTAPDCDNVFVVEPAMHGRHSG